MCLKNSSIFHLVSRMFYTKVTLLVLSVLWVDIVSGKLCYMLNFSDNPKDCKDFKNEKYIPNDLIMTPVEGEDGETYVGLSGPLKFKDEISEGMEIKIDALQETDHGYEPAMSAVTDICNSLSDEDAPWWPVVEALKVKSCPIEAKEYPIEDLIISLDFAKDVLSHQFVGEYLLQMSITQKTDTLGCFVMGAEISEYECEDDEE